MNCLHFPTIVDAGPAWVKVEEELARTGVRLPLFHRSAWAEHNGRSRHRLLTVRDGCGHLVMGVGMQVDASRVLPGHSYLRVHRFGHGLPEELWEPTLAALTNLARGDTRVLRLSIGVFSRDRRGDIGALLEQHGFRRAAKSLSYRHTLTIDLQPDEAGILHNLHKTARKNLRQAAKSPLFVRVLTDPVYAGRLAALRFESIKRTGGAYAKLDWVSILGMSKRYPELSRVAGMFTSESDVRPEALVGMGWGCMHGDHGEYRAAGTTRPPELHLPLSYPLVWDLMLWSREQGASWFDLGGVTMGEPGSDPLRGISGFKRYFSRNVAEVGEEWTLEPHPMRSQLASLLGRGVRGVRGVSGFADVLGRVRDGIQTDQMH